MGLLTIGYHRPSGVSDSVLRSLALIATSIAFIACATVPAVRTPTAPAVVATEQVPALRVFSPVATGSTPVQSGAVEATPTPVPGRFNPPSPTSGETPLPPVTGPAPYPIAPVSAVPTTGARRPARIVRVVDGDTVRLSIDGREEPVRLIGINTPESVDPRRPVECLGKEASAKAAEILTPGMMVQVEADPTQDTRDRFGRLLLYVWMPDGRLFNDFMIELGYATEYTYQTPYRYQTQFRATQSAATYGKRGLWADDACAGQIAPSRSSTAPAAINTPAPAKPQPTPVPKPALVPAAKPTALAVSTSAAARPGCDPSYPTVCIPPYPPDLDCGQIAFKRFVVLRPDPHGFDRDRDGIGCE